MDEFDGAQLKKMDVDKKEGTDQGSVAKTEPILTGPYVRQSSESDCTIGDTGKIMFYAGFACLLVYGAFKLVSKKSE